MSKKVDSYRYRELVKMAKENAERFLMNTDSAEKKELLANQIAEALDITDSEEKRIFVTNMLIPDEDFINVYFNNGSSAKKTAEYYNVPQSVVITKAASLELYEKEEDNIYDMPVFISEDNDKKDSDKTAEAISKISKLLELKSTQETTIDDKDSQIEGLNEEIKEKDDIIASLNRQIEEKDSVIENQTKLIEQKEKEIELHKVKIAQLLAYKDNYERIIKFLDENVENTEKNK